MWLPHRCMRHTWENGKCVISKWKTGITALNYTDKTDRKSCRTPLNRGAPDMISCLFYVMVYLSVSSFHNGPDIRFSEGERNSKEGAFIRTALNGYRTARQFQNPFRNRKSQAISATSQLPARAVKFLKYPPHGFLIHPDSRIGNHYLHKIRKKLHRSGDAASCRRKLDGVLKEVAPSMYRPPPR